MAAARHSGDTTVCADFDFNADQLDISLIDVEILTNGQLTLTQNDGTVFTNSIPYFPDFNISVVLTLQPPPNALTINYSAGLYQINGTVYTLTPAGSLAIAAGDPVNPRVDIVVVDTSSNISIITGTPAANPAPPATPVGSIVIGEIGVDANATALLGVTTMTTVNTGFRNNVNNGAVQNSTLRWESSISKWVSSTLIKESSFNARIGGGAVGTSEILQITGRVIIDDGAAPGITTNKLYAVAGNLFWDGIQLNTGTVASGTTVNSTLRWDGLAWIENVQFLAFDDPTNFGASNSAIFGTGTNNTIFGLNTLSSNTSGDSNIAVSINSLADNTSGNSNIGIGESSLTSNTTGSNNIGIGLNTLVLTTISNNNISLGNTSLTLITSGDFNVGVGNNNGAALISGNNNLFLGELAGAGVTNGDDNICLGYNSGSNTGVISNILAFGNAARASVDNQIIFGSSVSPYDEVYFGGGISDIAAHDFDINITNIITTANTVGGNLTVRGGGSTGSAAGGSIIFQNTKAGGAGATPNSFTTRLQLNTDNIELLGGLRYQQSSVQIVGFTVDKNFYIYRVDSTGGSITVSLPNSSISAGQSWFIKDVGGDASNNQITLSAGVQTIDNSASYILNVNYAGVEVVYDGLNYYTK